jgi:hypothetical protein
MSNKVGVFVEVSSEAAVQSLGKSFVRCTSLGTSSCEVPIEFPSYEEISEAMVRGGRVLGGNCHRKVAFLRSLNSTPEAYRERPDKATSAGMFGPLIAKRLPRFAARSIGLEWAYTADKLFGIWGHSS